ncbi:MAG: zinc protease [Bacteroidia bacterium]|jgi:zinc protease
MNRLNKRAAVAAPEVRAGAIIHEHTLRNGLRILLAERHSDPVVKVIVFYGVGSRSETDQEAGMSHFLEHMMFKGSAKYEKGQVDTLTTMLGGQNNAFTGNDHTAYWMRFAADRWETALEIEADRMQGLTLDPVEFNSERDVVLEELAMGEDEAWGVLAKRVEATIFGRHPYGRPIIGYRESLLAMEPADMHAFHARYYHPGNATLVIGGDFDPKQALRLIRKHFSKIEAGPKDADKDAFRLPMPDPGSAEVRLRMRWDDPGRRLIMAWPTDRVGTDTDYDLDVLSGIMTSGRGSRMIKSLVEGEGLATSISTSNDARVHAGIFWLFAECAQGVAPEILEAAIDEELRLIRDNKPSAAEIKRTHLMIQAQESASSEAIGDVAEELGSLAVDATWRLAFDGGEGHGKVTAKRVQATAKRLLTDERRIVAWSLPSDQVLDGGEA